MPSNPSMPERGEKNDPVENKAEKVDNSHLLDGSISGPKGDQQKQQGTESTERGLDRNTRPLTTDGTDTYKVPPTEKQYQAIKSYGDDTKSSGAARSVDLNLANGNSVKALDAFDRSTGQHTYIVQNPENGKVTMYKPVDGKTLEAIDHLGKPTGEKLDVKPNQIIHKDDAKEGAKPGEKPGETQNKAEGKPGENKAGEPADKADGKGKTEPLKGEVSKQEELEQHKHGDHHGHGHGHNRQLQDRLLAEKSEKMAEKPEGKSEKPEGKVDAGRDIKSGQIDGKLIAQLLTLGRNQELRDNLADMINKFQDGKLSATGKESGLFNALQGMKPGEVDGLKAWLTDGKKNPFDFKSLDSTTQQNLTKAFDAFASRVEERMTGVMVDLHGMRNANLDNAIPLRNLGDKQADYKVDVKDLNPQLQGLVDRIQSRIDPRELDAKNKKIEETKSSAEVPGPRDAQTKVEPSEIKKNPAEAEEGKKGGAADIKGTELTADQQKALAEEKEKEEARRKKLEEEQAEKERQEEKDQKKKQGDEERLYIVMENDTLNSISKKFFQRTDNAEIIYDRNLADIMLHDYKGVKYAKLYPRQRIIIPNTQYIDNFRKGSKSHKHLNFDKIPYATAEEELEQLFGQNWQGGGTAAEAPSGEHEAPVTRRSFSGNEAPVSDDERKANVHSAFGLDAPVNKYNVHLGESLRSIAQKFYKSPAYWRLIATKNNLSVDTDSRGNPVAVLRRGQQLILPEQSEVEEFARTLEASSPLAQKSEERAFIPRTIQCPSCKKETMAKAEKCVVCGAVLNSTPSSSAQDDDGGSGVQPAAILSALQDVVEQVAVVQLQEVTLTNKFQQMNFSPEQQAKEQRALKVVHPHPPHDPHPIPEAEYTAFELDYQLGDDPTLKASPDPVSLDQFVQVVESETTDGDVKGLVVVLQLLNQGVWHAVFDYHIFADVVVIHKYQRNGGRRMMKKSISAKQAKQMAWNHFRANWEAICKEYWSS